MAQVTPSKKRKTKAGPSRAAATSTRNRTEGSANVDGVPPYVPVYAPDRYNVKLRYADFLVAADADGVTGLQRWRYQLNSLFDPYYDVGGHQPNGFDKWAALFKYYRVMGARVKMSFHKSQYVGAETQRNYTPVAVGWHYDAGGMILGTNPVEWQNIAEMKEKHLEFLGYGEASCTMEYHYAPDQTGEKAITAVAQEEVWTPVTASATSPDILNVVICPSALNEDYYASCFLEIEFICQFADPVQYAGFVTSD